MDPGHVAEPRYRTDQEQNCQLRKSHSGTLHGSWVTTVLSGIPTEAMRKWLWLGPGWRNGKSIPCFTVLSGHGLPLSNHTWGPEQKRSSEQLHYQTFEAPTQNLVITIPRKVTHGCPRQALEFSGSVSTRNNFLENWKGGWGIKTWREGAPSLVCTRTRKATW